MAALLSLSSTCLTRTTTALPYPTTSFKVFHYTFPISFFTFLIAYSTHYHSSIFCCVDASIIYETLFHLHFQGNVKILNSKQLSVSSLRLKFKVGDGKHLVVRNQAAASSLSASPVESVRFRLDNLGPQPGSRKKGKRKGRGISAGQGGSCGFGMRGQKSRSGPGVRKGFEGGQMPLYRRIPKLRGIAGGNSYHST